jgi:hypothetical protein
MTRREAILIGLGLPLLGSDQKEFWNETKPADWTEDERSQILTHSPWARAADAKFNAGPGSLGNPRGSMVTRSGRVIPGMGAPGSAPGPGQMDSTVRWESALPVREAERTKSKDDPAAHYILSITGDLPGIGRATDETDDEYESRLDNLKQYTRLEKKGDPIYLVKIGYQPGKATDSGMRFYFERNDLITLHDGSVTFVTKLGPIDVKCKFPLKEMTYMGKLEL